MSDPGAVKVLKEPNAPKMTPLSFETERLRLRVFEPSDFDALHKLWTDRQVRKFLWDDAVISRGQAAEVINESIALFARRGIGFWTVNLKSDDCFIGFCGLREFGGPSEAELLYALYSSYWGKGLATEAAKAVLRRAFEFDNL